MARQHPPLVQRFLDKFSKSRDLSISLIVHAILVVFFGLFIVTKVVPPPPEIQGGLIKQEEASVPPPPPIVPPPPPVNSTASTPVQPGNNLQDSLKEIMGTSMETAVTTGSRVVAPQPPVPVPELPIATASPATDPGKLDPARARDIRIFTENWVKKDAAQFTAYIGRYSGGNWDSTVSIANGEIQTGSLPNLLYLMSFWSKNRVQTNYKNVKAIPLDSDEIFIVKPPFIFLTGSKDFILSQKEVENLQKYIRMGGCIWGDSSLPGERSRFDIAFRREMKRVVSDVDKNFEALPENHPIFSKGYFSEVKGVPAGLNYYRLPIYALKLYGEIAILYTANDYGDMWQIGLNKDGGIDERRNERGSYVAINRTLFNERGVYVRNISPEALAASYKFGANVVMHLLTRWESRVGSSSL